MLDEILSILNENQRKELTKCALVFGGGVAVGFVICKAMDSIDFDDFKNSVATNYEEKFNNQTDDISSTLDDLDDEFTE
jgi:hypothetical protein